MVILNSYRSERRIMDASSTFSYSRTRAYKLWNNTLFDLFSKRKTLSSPTYKNGLNDHPTRGLRCFRILSNIKFILFKASPTERKRSRQLVPLQFAKKALAFTILRWYTFYKPPFSIGTSQIAFQQTIGFLLPSSFKMRYQMIGVQLKFSS